MPQYPLRCDVRRTESTTGLLTDLHRSEPGFAPYLLTRFELTHEILDVTGIEPYDDPAACRWAALRNTTDGLDIVASVIRQDGRWARLHNDA
jgi:hypothetical protein